MCLRNDRYCVEWSIVKLYSLTHPSLSKILWSRAATAEKCGVLCDVSRREVATERSGDAQDSDDVSEDERVFEEAMNGGLDGRIEITTCRKLFPGTHKARCYFCGVWMRWVFRHQVSLHADEPEMAALLADRDRDRCALGQMRLRNLGVHLHNVDVLRRGRGGPFLVARGRHRASSPRDYMPCENCWACLHRDGFHGHHRRCYAARSTAAARQRDYSNAPFLMPTADQFLDCASELLETMDDGNVKVGTA